MDNQFGASDTNKEVVVEDTLDIEGQAKAPDYAFRIGPIRKFFVEAKKPGVDLHNDPKPALQLRRYAWTAQLPISILTDFDEFVVYDGRIKPKEKDTPSTARLQYWKYTDYENCWPQIENLFSKKRVHQDSIEDFIGKGPARGTEQVGDAFLDDIESWRTSLAKNIALPNPALSTLEMNIAVGLIIDRILFLRICEDRRIEPYDKATFVL
jgi:hypothetical protein